MGRGFLRGWPWGVCACLGNALETGGGRALRRTCLERGMLRSSRRVTTALGTSACVHRTSRCLVGMGSVEPFETSSFVGGATASLALELAQPARSNRPNVSAGWQHGDDGRWRPAHPLFCGGFRGRLLSK
jgi:hypothetical protein